MSIRKTNNIIVESCWTLNIKTTFYISIHIHRHTSLYTMIAINSQVTSSPYITTVVNSMCSYMTMVVSQMSMTSNTMSWDPMSVCIMTWDMSMPMSMRIVNNYITWRINIIINSIISIFKRFCYIKLFNFRSNG